MKDGKKASSIPLAGFVASHHRAVFCSWPTNHHRRPRAGAGAHTGWSVVPSPLRIFQPNLKLLARKRNQDQ